MVAVKIPTANYIFADIISIFRPLAVLQNVHVSPRYRIKNNCVTPNSVPVKIICFIAVIASTVVFFCRVVSYRNTCSVISSVVRYYGFIMDLIVDMIGLLVNYKTNIFDSSTNVDLMIRMQRITVPLHNRKTIKRTIIYSRIGSSIIIIHNFINIVITYITRPLSYFFSVYFLQSFDNNIVFVTFTMRVIRNSLEVWISKVKSQSEMNSTINRKMYRMYLEIIETFEFNKQCYKLVVLVFLTTMVFKALYLLQHDIEDIRSHVSASELSVFEGIKFVSIWNFWILKNLLLLSILCWECEKVYLAFRESRVMCTIKSVSGCSRMEKKICKAIRRVNRNVTKFSACGWVDIDATLPFALIAIIFSYFLVILQFFVL